MKQQEEQQCINLIDDFDDYVSLSNIISNNLSLIKIQKIVDKITHDRFGTSDYKYPSILIAGKIGKRTHGISLLRSLGIDNYQVIESQLYGHTGFSVRHFSNTHEGVVLCNVEHLDQQCQKIVLDVIKNRKFTFFNYMNQDKVVYHYDGILIMTCGDISKVHEQVYKSVSHFVQILPYDQTELELMVLQRLKFSGIEIDDGLSGKIVQQGGDLHNIIRFLKDTVMVMRAEGRKCITEEDIEMVKRLN